MAIARSMMLKRIISQSEIQKNFALSDYFLLIFITKPKYLIKVFFFFLEIILKKPKDDYDEPCTFGYFYCPGSASCVKEGKSCPITSIIFQETPPEDEGYERV